MAKLKNENGQKIEIPKNAANYKRDSMKQNVYIISTAFQMKKITLATHSKADFVFTF